MKRVAPVLALSLLLSACASTPEGERMTWGYAEPSDPEGPKLAFGVDGTDYLAVIFFCDPSTGVVAFDVPTAEGHDVPAVKLRSGGVERRYDALVPQEIEGYEVSHFKTDRADPLLKAFVKSGKLALDAYGSFVSHDVKAASERDAVANFAKACGLR